MNTQQIIINLKKIEQVSDEELEIIELACEKLAFLQNKLNSNAYRS